jgi:hypothetical protein
LTSKRHRVKIFAYSLQHRKAMGRFLKSHLAKAGCERRCVFCRSSDNMDGCLSSSGEREREREREGGRNRKRENAHSFGGPLNWKVF